MGRWKGGHNRHEFRMSQHVTYQGRPAIVINNTSLTLVKKIVVLMQDGAKERLEVPIDAVTKGWSNQ
jgi:hypothetical protein